MQIEPRKPKTLHRGPLHKAHVPEINKSSQEWIGFVEGVRNHGSIHTPLFTTPDGLVLDGWWRREAAVDLNLDSVPVIIREAKEEALILVESNTERKQMTRGGVVYFALGVEAEYAAAAERRRIRNATVGIKTQEEKIEVRSTPHPASNRYLAFRWGCDESTIRQAREVRAVFHNLKTFTAWLKEQLHDKVSDPAKLQTELREEFEALLYSGEKSLWQILQAAAGRLSGKRKDRPDEQLDLFEDGLYSWAKRLGRFDADVFDKFRRKLPALMKKIAPDDRRALKEFAALIDAAIPDLEPELVES